MCQSLDLLRSLDIGEWAQAEEISQDGHRSCCISSLDYLSILYITPLPRLRFWNSQDTEPGFVVQYRKKEEEEEKSQVGGWMLTLPFSPYMTLGKSLSLSESHFHPITTENNTVRVRKVYVRCLAHVLVSRRGSVNGSSYTDSKNWAVLRVSLVLLWVGEGEKTLSRRGRNSDAWIAVEGSCPGHTCLKQVRGNSGGISPPPKKKEEPLEQEAEISCSRGDCTSIIIKV